MQDGEKRNLTVLPKAELAGSLGAVVPLRALRDAPLPPDADLSNVIAFRRRVGPEREAPTLVADATARVVPWWREKRTIFAALLVASAVLHAGLYAIFNREPEPLASIGVEAISVEIVLGANTNAGTAATPSPSEAQVDSAGNPEEQKPQAEQVETAKHDPVAKDQDTETALRGVEDTAKAAETAAKPAEEAKLAEDTKPVEEAKAPEPQEVAKAQPAPVIETTPTPEAKAPELAATDPEPVPSIIAPEPKPQTAKQKTAAVKDTPKKPRETKRAAADGEGTRNRAPAAAIYSVASSGVGVGRSDNNANYHGMVRAHLARYKQYPSDARARGDQGNASVTFSLSESGGVTSVRLARGSGIPSLDQEAVAMVRRASPFPAPPNGEAQIFTVPVGFDLH